MCTFNKRSDENKEMRKYGSEVPRKKELVKVVGGAGSILSGRQRQADRHLVDMSAG